MKKLAHISLVLFTSVITFSSCEEETILTDSTQNAINAQSESGTSNSQGSDRFENNSDKSLNRVVIDREGR
jgi:hypothetical protein